MRKYLIGSLFIVFVFAQTPNQVKKAKEMLRSNSISESQLRNAAKSKGYSDQQINDAIQNEIKSKNGSEDLKNLVQEKPKLNNLELDQDEQNQIDAEQNEEPFEELIEEDLDKSSKAQQLIVPQSYFGYNIFKRSPDIFQSTSVGAVNPDYLIGPGDEIIVMLWGETQFRQVLKVDREGFVFIPEIGQVFVNGLNLNLLESKLFRLFSQSYASLNPNNREPTTFLDVSLGKLRPLRIQVLGEVMQPGAYTVSPSATLFSSIYYFNGPTTLGSLRDIRLIRNGEKIESIDFYDYLLTGKKPRDKKLQLDDVIFIPRRLKTITVQGEVNRSGKYELKPDEGLKDLILFSGGLKHTAYLKRSQIDRIVPFDTRDSLGMDRMIVDIDLGRILNSEEIFELIDGDHINIFSILDIRENTVSIGGAVTRPGTYDLKDSLKLSELIEKADGLLGDAYMERLDLIRTNADFTEKLIKVNLEEVLSGASSDDIQLMGMDRVQVYRTTEMIYENYVFINGHVRNEGSFKLVEDMRINDLLFMGGGLADEEFKKGANMFRADLIRFDENKIKQSIIPFNLGNVLSDKNDKENYMLRPGDIVKVYSEKLFNSSMPISINGAVRKPGNYKYKDNMTLKDLILEADGMYGDVYRYRVEIARIDLVNSNLSHYAKVITFNIDKKFDLYEIPSTDIVKQQSIELSNNYNLEPYDLVSIRPDPYFHYQKKIKISGEVLYPGEYTILSSDEKVSNIIERAGGLLPNAYPRASIFKRNGLEIKIGLEEIVNNPASKLNFTVYDKDELSIPPHFNLVNIIGEVNRPGIHKYIPGKRLKYYLKLSGGLGVDADLENIWIDYPDGDSKKYNKWSLLGPRVFDGSVINIGKVKEEEPLDRTEYAKEITAILANLAQAVGIVILARN